LAQGILPCLSAHGVYPKPLGSLSASEDRRACETLPKAQGGRHRRFQWRRAPEAAELHIAPFAVRCSAWGAGAAACHRAHESVTGFHVRSTRRACSELPPRRPRPASIQVAAVPTEEEVRFAARFPGGGGVAGSR